MEKTSNKISAEDYCIYKQLLRKPSDDKMLTASLGLSARTAREIRLSKNYRDYKTRLKQKKKLESITKQFKYIETPRRKADRARSEELDREAEKSARLVGWIGILLIVALIAFGVWGAAKSVQGLIICR